MRSLVSLVLVVPVVATCAACGRKEPVPAPVVPVPVIAIAQPPVPDAAPEQPLARLPSPSRTRLSLLLRSTPGGALVSVDGRPVGNTPLRYEVDDDGREHEFTFTLAGHAPWIVRFSPVQNGMIHATLQETLRDAGM